MDISRVMAATALIGNAVRNPEGEDLGKIEDLVIDVQEGVIAYAVLTFGGFLGMGDKLFAIPWSALALDADEQQFVLDVDRDTLKQAPGFDKDNWPDMADRRWGAQIHQYYHREPYWKVI